MRSWQDGRGGNLTQMRSWQGGRRGGKPNGSVSKEAREDSTLSKRGSKWRWRNMLPQDLNDDGWGSTQHFTACQLHIYPLPHFSPFRPVHFYPSLVKFFLFSPSLVQLPFLSNHGQRPISARSPASVDFDNWTWSRWMTLKLNFSEANKCVSCGEHLQMCLMWRKFTNVSHVEKIYFEKSCYAMKRSSHVMFSRI